jgi:hypothetical protein
MTPEKLAELDATAAERAGSLEPSTPTLAPTSADEPQPDPAAVTDAPVIAAAEPAEGENHG